MTANVCSANYVVKNGKLYMKLYTENDVEEVEAYPEPYCFVPSAYDVDSKFSIRVENTSLKTLDTNENVKKYSFMFPAHVKNFRDNIERFGRRVYEGDIPYTKRWMIDNDIKCSSYENVKAYWDIEVLDTNGFPDQETASEPIIAISVKRDGIETFQGDEKDILSNFLSYLKEEHVRLLIGWNSDWDKEYFVKRCRKNGVNVDEHSIRFLDIMQFYRYTVNRSRYSLSYVAKEFNETKPYEGRRMKDLKEEEIRERNVWDTLMTEKVDMKFHFSKLAVHLAQMSNLFPDLVLGKREDKNTVTPSPVHTNIILKRARALGYVCPSYVERTHEKYKGAYIHMPKSGIYENILEYDYNSLYPNIIIGFELAPWNRKEVFIPIVKEYLEQKEKAKDEIEYMAYKLLVNSMYGFFSSPYSRVYSSEVGEKVAEKGREIILFTIKFIESIGFKVIYGDTDSIFIQAPFEKKDIIQNLINEAIRQQFNVSNIRMKFEGYWSKILFPLSSAGTSVKKRYAGIIAVGKNGEKNRMEIVGLEHERGDWCFIDGTEILTINGWKNFRDVTEEDFVATLGKDGFLEYQKPIKIIRKDYDGEIIKIENKSIEIGVTPEHRMLVKENESKEYKFIEARNLVKSYYRFLRTAKWQGKKKDYFDVVGYNIKTEDWVRFMALWLAEGWADKRKVYIGQKNKIQLVREILNKLPFKYTEKTDKNGVTTFTIYSSALAKMLSKYGHAKDKFVDQNIKELESNMIRCFLDTFVEFDGYISHGSKEYCTSSKRLADDLQEMLLKCGSLGTIRECTEKGYKGKHLIYRIRERKFHEGYVEKKDIKRINYRGKVFCVTVPNGIIFVRYKGKPIWCGNCDLAKKVQEDVLKMLLEGKTRKEIEEYARKVIDDMKCGKYDDMLVLSKSVSKGLEEYKVNAQHVKALRDAIEKGLVTEDFKKYGVIHYVICRKGVPKIVDFVKKGEIDYTYYEKNQIMPILKRLGIFVPEDKTEKMEKFFT